MASDYFVGGLDHDSFDINASGDFIYIAVLDSSLLPEILKISTELDSDATTSYAPGDGDTINVKCGDYDNGIVWAAGNFGTNDKVAKFDSIEGIYWVTQNPTGWVGVAQPLMVGPGDDNIVMVAIDTDDDLHETYFMGESLYWTRRNEDLPFDVGAIDRWDINIDEVLIGIDEAVYFYDEENIINYSPNRGIVWGDVSMQLEGNKITSLIVG